MEDGKIGLEEIMRDYIKGLHVKWDGAFCTYKGIDIISLFGTDRVTAVWIRQSMPDAREMWIDARDPDFFKKVDVAFDNAKKIVDYADETKELFSKFRDHLGY